MVEYAKLYKLQIDFPYMFSQGKYTIDGRIAFLPIKGSGDFQGNFSNVNLNHILGSTTLNIFLSSRCDLRSQDQARKEENKRPRTRRCF